MPSIRTRSVIPSLVATLLILASSTLQAQQEIPLRLWMQVKGDSLPKAPDGAKMGLFVTAVPAGSPNLPYRGAVSCYGRTNFYTLKDSLDKTPAYSLRGENLILGDLNGDGLTDAVVANYVAGYARNNLDTVFVYWGVGQGGVDTVHPLAIPSLGRPTGGDILCPAVIADVNNDGKPDLLLYGEFGMQYGEVHVHFGPAPSPTPDKILYGDSTYRYFGFGGENVAVGDLNADGLNDLVIRGAFGRLADSNWVRIYWGRASSLALDSVSEMHGGQYVWFPVACFDVNGDGIADLVREDRDSISGPSHNDILVNLGGPTFSLHPNLRLQNPGGVGLFGQSNGHSIVSAGDMNGDGFSDIAIGAYQLNRVDGYVFVYGGGPRVDSRFDAAVGVLRHDKFGWTLASIGDVNGDGVCDLLVGAPGYYFLSDQGYWAVILGSKAMTVTGVEISRNQALPALTELRQNYPNPFNPTTTIEYSVPMSGLQGQATKNVKLAVYDILGREVTLLVNEDQPPGAYQVTFDGARLASGVYTYQLIVGDQIQARQMILIK